MTFMQSLQTAWQRNASLVCVGLDPEPARFPAHLRGRTDAVFEFCRAIVDATAAGDAMARLRDRGVPSWPCGVVRDRRDGEAGDAEAKGGGGGAALVLGEHPA